MKKETKDTDEFFENFEDEHLRRHYDSIDEFNVEDDVGYGNSEDSQPRVTKTESSIIYAIVAGAVVATAYTIINLISKL